MAVAANPVICHCCYDGATATYSAGMSELRSEDLAERLSAADAAAAAALKRAAEIRAEAAMLVESVEDRAHEAVMEAKAETKRHSAEADRLRAELQRIRGQ